jgi:hypothetical protein
MKKNLYLMLLCCAIPAGFGSCIWFEEIDSLQRIEKKTIVSFKPIGVNFAMR